MPENSEAHGVFFSMWLFLLGYHRIDEKFINPMQLLHQQGPRELRQGFIHTLIHSFCG